MQKTRTFVALELSAEVRRRAVKLIERLRSDGVSFNWVKPNNLHLTLCFLGDVDDSGLNDVCAAVADAAKRTSPFEVSFRGLGAFPDSNRPRTLWLGVKLGGEPLLDLQNRVETALDGLGFAPERRKYHPHLTLGRLRRGDQAGQVSDFILAQADYDAAAMSVNQVIVFSSLLEREGPVHAALSRAPLGHS